MLNKKEVEEIFSYYGAELNSEGKTTIIINGQEKEIDDVLMQSIFKNSHVVDYLYGSDSEKTFKVQVKVGQECKQSDYINEFVNFSMAA